MRATCGDWAGAMSKVEHYGGVQTSESPRNAVDCSARRNKGLVFGNAGEVVLVPPEHTNFVRKFRFRS